MAAPTIVLDGSAPYGTGSPISISGVTYILENINIDRGNSEANSRDGSGRPNRARYTADVPTMTADLQLATSSTAYPAFGATFTYTADNAAYGSETWIVLPQNFVATNGEGDIRIAPLRAKKAINPTGVTTVA
ncbi:MAG: hypothetical protein WC069_06180 [Candidatus Shapirobacteria bacterium]